MRIRTFLAAIALVIAFSVPEISRAATAPAAVTLRYKFEEGQAVYYKLRDDSTMSSASLPADMLPKTHAEFVYKMTVHDVRPDGRAAVTYTQESSSLTLNGAPSAMPSGGPAASSLTCVMSPTGRVLSSSLGAAEDPGASDGANSLQQDTAAFPKAPAKVGDTWSSILSPGTSGGLTGTVRYELVGIVSSGGKTLATIKTSTDATFQQNAPGGIAFSGHVTADGTLTFDVTKGRIESSIETSHASLAPAGGGADMAGANFDVQTQSAMERVAD